MTILRLLGALFWLVFWAAGALTLFPAFAAWVERANDPERRAERRLVPNLAGIVATAWEWGCNMIVIAVSLALGWVERDPAPRPARRPPVVLVHGYLHTRAVWWYFRHRLREAGYLNTFTVQLRPTGSMDEHVERLRARLDQLAATAADGRFILIGHSLGGLVVRGYLARYGDARCARAVLIATPNHGTRLAFLGFGPAAEAMRPESEFLRTLNAIPASAPAGRTVVVFSRFDNEVLPWTSARLAGAQEVDFDYLGHNNLLLSRDVAEGVIGVLERA